MRLMSNGPRCTTHRNEQPMVATALVGEIAPGVIQTGRRRGNTARKPPSSPWHPQIRLENSRPVAMDAASGDSWAVSAASRTPSASQSNKGANPDGGGNYSSVAARQSAPERFGD